MKTRISSKPASSSPGRPSSNKLSQAPAAQISSIPPNDDPMESLEKLQDMVSPSDLSVVFQPIVNLQTGRVFAHEALVRCSVAEYQAPPVLFEAAVARGCTGRLGRMIREIGVPLCDGRLFVNIHPAELSEGWLVRPDDPIYQHHDEVFLEVTESVPMTHFKLCMSVLKEISSRGSVHLVVDDLGAGYSNLLRIADLEPRIVKLDRELIVSLDTEPRKRELVAAVVDMCVRLGSKVVAEGIETLGELDAVQQAGVHYGQGYLLGRPAFPPDRVRWPVVAEQHSLVPPTEPSAS